MAVSAVFDLIDALVAQLPAAMPPGVQVFDGFPDTDATPAQFVVIGVPDPTDESAATSASSQQQWGPIGNRARDEEGDVFCVANVTNGDGSASAARASLKAILTAVESLLRTDPTLGVPTLLWTSYGTSTDLMQDQDDLGALAMLTFSIHYRARI